MHRTETPANAQEEIRIEATEVRAFLGQSSAYKALQAIFGDEHVRQSIKADSYVVIDVNFRVWDEMREAHSFSKLLKLTTKLNFTYLQVSFLEAEKSKANPSSGIFPSTTLEKTPIGQLHLFRKEIAEKMNARELKLADIAGKTYRPPGS